MPSMSLMPAVRGEHADTSAYFTYQEEHHDPLDFLLQWQQISVQANVSGMPKIWSRRKSTREWQIDCCMLLEAITGAIPSNKVIIVIGMSKFDRHKGLTSLDNSFQSYIVSKVSYNFSEPWLLTRWKVTCVFIANATCILLFSFVKPSPRII